MSSYKEALSVSRSRYQEVAADFPGQLISNSLSVEQRGVSDLLAGNGRRSVRSPPYSQFSVF